MATPLLRSKPSFGPSSDSGPTPGPYPAAPPPKGAEVSCTGEDWLEFVADPTRYCKPVVTYWLAGCEDNPDCSEPEWDLRDAPPDWWPCTGDTRNGYRLVDATGPLTAEGGEALFRIVNVNADEAYEVSELEVRVQTEPDTYFDLTGSGLVHHVDSDGDKLFSPGDELTSQEPQTLSLFDEHRHRVLSVQLVKRTGPNSLLLLAEFDWDPEKN